MQENPEITEKEELEIYRQAIANLGKPPTVWERIEKWLAILCFYLSVSLFVFLCWNYSLCRIWPEIPQIQLGQSMGLLGLFYVVKKL